VKRPLRYLGGLFVLDAWLSGSGELAPRGQILAGVTESGDRRFLISAPRRGAGLFVVSRMLPGVCFPKPWIEAAWRRSQISLKNQGIG
jgi:hypothetical protein